MSLSTKGLMEQIKKLEQTIKDINPKLKEANKYKMIDSYRNQIIPLKLKKQKINKDLKELRKQLATNRKYER